MQDKDKRLVTEDKLKSKVDALQARLDELETDTGWVQITPDSVMSGWALDTRPNYEFMYRRKGNVFSIRGDFTYTSGPDITADSYGNIADINGLINFDGSIFPDETPHTLYLSSVIRGFCTVSIRTTPTVGAIDLVATAPNYVIKAGDGRTFHFEGTYIY